MDYNSIDEDDVEKLRLAALMTFKKKANVPLSTISSTSGEFCKKKFANGNSYSNSTRNNRGRFSTSNRSYNKRTYTNVGFRRPTHANNNLIAIIPTDSESDTQTNDSTKNVNSKFISTSDNKSTDVMNVNNEVSTKFSRLENESGSEESEDSETERGRKEESDDGDVLFLGEEDEDLDDLDKLMDIMEAEINGGDINVSKKEKKSLKQNNRNKKEKGSEFKAKCKLNTKVDEPIVMNHPKIIEDSKPQSHVLEAELESIKTLEEIRNSSPSHCSLLKSHIPLKSHSPPIRKRSVSPYSKLRKRSISPRSPRRRSPSPDRYRYSPVRSRPYRRSLSPRRSPRRLSPLREKNLSPRRYSPQQSRYPYRSPSPRRRRRSLSRDISPSRRRLSPLRRRSRSPLKIKSRSRSPKVRSSMRRRSPSPLKKLIKSRPISPTIRRKDNKIIDDDHFKKREKVKTFDKQVESRPIDPVLEARKRKFESNKPIEPTRKKIILKKTNSVQVAIQTENKETQNEKVETETKQKIMHLVKKAKKNSPQAFQAPKNISIKMNTDLENVNLRRVVKVNTSPEKTNNIKRPRIVFGHEETNELLANEEDIFHQHNKNIKTNARVTKVIQSEALEVSSASEEELSEEEVSEENEDEESEKEDGQESSESCEEYVEEEEDEDIQEIQQVVDDKTESIQHNDTVDLRTELKRRRALRLNLVHQAEVKKKPESFYPARLLQSAIRGVVGSSSSIAVKRKKHSKIPEISIKTEGNSDGRRVIVVNRDKTRNDAGISLPENEEGYDDEVESYASVKRLKGKLKKVPIHVPRTTSVNHDNTIQKGLRKIIKRNINVTNFDQM